MDGHVDVGGEDGTQQGAVRGQARRQGAGARVCVWNRMEREREGEGYEREAPGSDRRYEYRQADLRGTQLWTIQGKEGG